MTQANYVNIRIISRSETIEHKRHKGANAFHTLQTTHKCTGKIHTRYVADSEFHRVEEHCETLGLSDISLEQAMRIISGGRADYFTKFKGSDRKQISMSRGMLCMLVNALTQDDVFKLSGGTTDAIAYLLGTESNSDPARQQRRDRNQAKAHLVGLISRLSHDKKHSSRSLSSVLFADIAGHVKSALDKLMQLKHRLANVHCKRISGSILTALKKPFKTTIKHVANKICGHFYPEYCPQ